MAEWLSGISLEDLLRLPDEQKWDILSRGVRDDGASGDVALLLGSIPERAKERAEAAARLYGAGRVRTIIPTGGVLWDDGGEQLTEAETMRRVLLARGVPDSAILPENEATTTRENMLYGARLVRERIGVPLGGVIVVTGVLHMKRSVALARGVFPEAVRVTAFPSWPAQGKEAWLREAGSREHLDNNLRLLKELIDGGEAPDVPLL